MGILNWYKTTKAKNRKKNEEWYAGYLKKKAAKVNSVPVKRAPSRMPKIGKATKLNNVVEAPTPTNSNAFVVMSSNNNNVNRRFWVKYKSDTGNKFNREWFVNRSDAEQFARSKASQFNVNVKVE